MFKKIVMNEAERRCLDMNITLDSLSLTARYRMLYEIALELLELKGK